MKHVTPVCGEKLLVYTLSVTGSMAIIKAHLTIRDVVLHVISERIIWTDLLSRKNETRGMSDLIHKWFFLI